MANNCCFDMKITGGEEGIKELVSMLRWEGKFKEAGLGRIYSFEADEIEKTNIPGVYQTRGAGDCAWSVLTAMQNYGGRHPSLESETGRLGLVVEVYSSEPGIGFQEHILIAMGSVIISDCVDYSEHWVEGPEHLEEYNQEYGTDFTPDMLDENGDVCIGGYGDSYGDFADVSEYFAFEKEVQPASIDDQIRAAAELKTEPALTGGVAPTVGARF